MLHNWHAQSQGAHTGYSNEKMVRNDPKLDEIRLSRDQSRAGRCEIDERVGAGGRRMEGGCGVGGEWRVDFPRPHSPPLLRPPAPTPSSISHLPARDWTRDNRISSSFRPFRTIYSLEYPVWATCGPIDCLGTSPGEGIVNLTLELKASIFAVCQPNSFVLLHMRVNQCPLFSAFHALSSPSFETWQDS